MQEVAKLRTISCKLIIQIENTLEYLLDIDDRALTLFNRIMPNYESYNNIGYLCLLNKKYDYAEKYLQMAINQSPVYFLKANENLKSLRALSTH